MSEKRLSITQWALDDRPREKLMLKGKKALSDAELLAILIGSGTKTDSALDLAKRILTVCNLDLNQLARMEVKDFIKIKGIGEARAITIMAAIELGRRRKEIQIELNPSLVSSNLIYQFMRPEMLDLQQEQFWVLLLNNALRPIKKVKIGDGGIAFVSVDIRIIFKEALENYATNIALVHNHPSGKLEPSKEDDALTEKITSAGKLLNIRVIDHLIFTNSGYFSYADQNRI